MRRLPRRRLSLAAAAILVVLAGAHTLLWRWAVAQVAAETLAWAAAERAQGWIISFDPPQPEGWPMAAQVRLAQVSLGPANGGGVTYQADAARIGVALLQPRMLRVEMLGQQRLRVGTGPEIGFTAARAEITMPLAQNQQPDRLDLLVTGVSGTTTWTTAANLAPRPAAFAVRQARLQAEGLTGAAQHVTLAIDAIDLPADTALAAMGPGIQRVGLDATISRPLADPVAWRDGGGKVDVARMTLDWGRLSVAADAAMQLDAGLQPSGAGHARLSGTGETLDALVSGRVLAARPATAAKAVLALLSRPQDSGPPVVDVPFTLKDRTLRIGSIPITRLPEMAW